MLSLVFAAAAAVAAPATSCDSLQSMATPQVAITTEAVAAVTMAVGNGGFGGSIQGIGEMQTAVRLGYATAGGDTGHDEATEDPGGMFALGHPEKIVGRR